MKGFRGLFLWRWIADFKRTITQINFYIADAYENCDKEKQKREREVRRLWLNARSLLALDVFALVASKSDAYIILVSPLASSVDEIYYAFNRRVFNDFIS